MSEGTDWAETKRRKIAEYDAILGDIEVSYNEFGDSQKEKIKRLAKILDESKHPKENICAKVCQDVAKFGIKERYVRKILPDEYKDLIKRNIELCGPRAASDEIEDEKKKPLLVTANGETVNENPESSQDELDSIYRKPIEQMRVETEAAKEVQEDNEETLENPRNVIPTKTNFISDNSPEIREKLARFEEQEQLIQQLVEDRDHAILQQEVLSKKYRHMKSGAQDQELYDLKAKVNNLQTLLNDSNQQVKTEDNYKEIEILKLDTQRVSWLLQTSKTSEKTLFLRVNPKTQEIIDVKTDKDMHRIQAQRKENAELAKQQQEGVASA